MNGWSQTPDGQAASAGLGRVLSAAGQGALQAFGSNPLGLSDDHYAALQQGGIVPPAQGAGTPMQHVNGAVLGGVQAGVSQAGEEVGAPQLGRDLAAVPEAFPFGLSRGAPAPQDALTGPVTIETNLASKGPRIYTRPTEATVGDGLGLGTGGTGNLPAGGALYDAEGRSLNAPCIAGGRSPGSLDQTALSPAEVNAVATQGLGASPLTVAA